MAIWVTSDWHFCHNRDFLYKPRGFDNVQDMNRAIIHRHNCRVNWDDDIYVLGDCMLNDNDEGRRCIARLGGRIHIICGNHDSDARKLIYNDIHNVVEVVDGKFLRNGKYHFYLSHYPCLTSNWDEDKPLKARVVNLCGHSHTKDHFADWDKGLIFHCEMDTNNCEPIPLEHIIKKIENKLGEK